MNKYCLDTNFFIEAWNKYYAPDFCNGYWRIIEDLGRSGRIFIPEMVKQEIYKTDDTLKKWFEDKVFLIQPISASVQHCLTSIFEKDPSHHRLVDNTKNRSIADPWVIAHAMDQKAIVVTKEHFETHNTAKIKIPNVCRNMGVKYIDDFMFIRELNIGFDCTCI